MKFKALLLTCNIPNKNGRIYTKESAQAEIESALFLERLNTGSLFGEKGSPIDSNFSRQLSIDITKISHKFTKIYFEGDDLYGEGETLNTSSGRDLEELMKQNTPIEFALRGIGKLESTTYDYKPAYIVKDLKISTFDWVVTNSNYKKDFVTLMTDEDNQK